MTDTYMKVAGYEFTEQDAQEVIAGYCLGRYESRLQRRGACRGIDRRVIQAPRWGYTTYDCVLPSPTPKCEPVDYLVTSGLNGRLDVSSVGALQAACPPAFGELAQIDEDVVFWDLDPNRLVAFPEEACPERHLWLAWCYMMTMPELGVALTHKTLHHKRPRLFPLIDGRTVKAFDNKKAWKTIHEDLNQNGGRPFSELEEWFAKLVTAREDCVPLSRLRLHDILLWCRIMPGQEEEAARKGKQFV